MIFACWNEEKRLNRIGHNKNLNLNLRVNIVQNGELCKLWFISSFNGNEVSNFSQLYLPNSDDKFSFRWILFLTTVAIQLFVLMILCQSARRLCIRNFISIRNIFKIFHTKQNAQTISARERKNVAKWVFGISAKDWALLKPKCVNVLCLNLFCSD